MVSEVVHEPVGGQRLIAGHHQTHSVGQDGKPGEGRVEHPEVVACDVRRNSPRVEHRGQGLTGAVAAVEVAQDRVEPEAAFERRGGPVFVVGAGG